MASANSSKQKVFEALLVRMNKNKDFPALSESISTIYQLVSRSEVSVNELANTILNDFSLTNKLLKLVNSAFYGQTGEEIGTITRAINVLGFEQIRNAASSLLLFENIKNRAHSGELLDTAYRSLFSGSIARDIAKTTDVDEEEARICAMFHCLGTILTIFYFPEEYEKILGLIRQEGISEKSASIHVMGMSFEELGQEIARTWKFPDIIIASMQAVASPLDSKPQTATEKLRAVSAFSNEICKVASVGDADERREAMKRLTSRFKNWHTFTEHDIAGTLERSLQEVTTHSAVFEINTRKSQFFRRIQNLTAGKSTADSGTGTDADPALTSEDVRSAMGEDETPSVDGPRRDPTAIFLKGLQEITTAMLGTSSIDDIFRMILETMYRAIGFSRVLLCIRDQKKTMVVARFGFGQGMDRLINHFAVPLDQNRTDVFSQSLLDGKDILVPAAGDPQWKPKVPFWYRQIANAETFILLPIMVGGVNIGLFYADFITGGGGRLSEESITYLKTLRDQSVLAIKTRK